MFPTAVVQSDLNECMSNCENCLKQRKKISAFFLNDSGKKRGGGI
jgi:hypothetical protein